MCVYIYTYYSQTKYICYGNAQTLVPSTDGPARAAPRRPCSLACHCYFMTCLMSMNAGPVHDDVHR